MIRERLDQLRDVVDASTRSGSCPWCSMPASGLTRVVGELIGSRRLDIDDETMIVMTRRYVCHWCDKAFRTTAELPRSELEST